MYKKLLKPKLTNQISSETKFMETENSIPIDTITDIGQIIGECQNLCINYEQSNSELKPKFFDEVTCLHKFFNSLEAPKAATKELIFHRTYLGNAVAIITKFDQLQQKYHQCLIETHFYIDPKVKESIEKTEDFLLHGSYTNPNEVVAVIETFDFTISSLVGQNEEFHKHIRFLQDSINSIFQQMDLLPPPPKSIKVVTLETLVTEQTITPLLEYLTQQATLIHSLDFYNTVSRKWPAFQRVCNNLKTIHKKLQDMKKLIEKISYTIDELPVNHELTKKFDIISNIVKHTSIYDTTVQIAESTETKLLELQQNISEEILLLNTQIDKKETELRYKMDQFNSIINNNKLLPDISQKYFKTRRAISDWLTNKKRQKKYIEYERRITEINSLINYYYNDFYLRVSAECEKYLTDNRMYAKHIQYQEVEEQFELLQNYTSKNYDHVYILYEQLIPLFQFKFSKEEPLSALVQVHKPKSSKKKKVQTPQSSSVSHSSKESPSDSPKMSPDISPRDTPNKHTEECSANQPTVTKVVTLSEPPKPKPEVFEPPKKPFFPQLNSDFFNSIYVVLLPILVFLYDTFISLPLYYLMYFPSGFYFSLFYLFSFQEDKKYNEGDLVYYFGFPSWNKWWCRCRVTAKKQSEKLTNLIDIDTAESYLQIDNELIYTHYAKDFFSSTTVGKLNRKIFLDKNYNSYYTPNKLSTKIYALKEKVEVHSTSDRWIEGVITEYDKKSKRYSISSDRDMYSNIPNYAIRPIYKIGTKAKYRISTLSVSDTCKITDFIGDGLYRVDLNNSEHSVGFYNIIID